MYVNEEDLESLVLRAHSCSPRFVTMDTVGLSELVEICLMKKEESSATENVQVKTILASSFQHSNRQPACQVSKTRLLINDTDGDFKAKLIKHMCAVYVPLQHIVLY